METRNGKILPDGRGWAVRWDETKDNNAVMALKFACNSNGLNGEELALNMKPIGPSVA